MKLARPLQRKRRTKAEVEAIREAAREELAAGLPMTIPLAVLSGLSKRFLLTGRVPVNLSSHILTVTVTGSC